MLNVVTLGGDREDELRTPALPFSQVDGETEALAELMIETMRAGGGVGLAGPQVGVDRRIFVTEAPGEAPRVFINPEIIRTSPDLVVYEEGCLSLPGVFAEVVRPEQISIQALDRRGKSFVLDAAGFLARVIQHEYDHLRGILFVDHLSDQKREKVLKLYRKKMKV